MIGYGIRGITNIPVKKVSKNSKAKDKRSRLYKAAKNFKSVEYQARILRMRNFTKLH